MASWVRRLCATGAISGCEALGGRGAGAAVPPRSRRWTWFAVAARATIAGAVAMRSERRVDVTALLDEFEEAVEHLRVSYEKYFAGVDKVAPVKERERVERSLRNLEKIHTASTALRFRLGGLRARLVTYKHYWNRVQRELEQGLSRRDLMRMRRGLGGPGRKKVYDQEAPTGARSGNGSSEDAPVNAEELRRVYEDLVRAKKAAGESTEGLTYAALCRKLTRETPKLLQKHRCTAVRFEVETIAGKVRLKARPS